jgi:hypothetical protein
MRYSSEGIDEKKSGIVSKVNLTRDRELHRMQPQKNKKIPVIKKIFRKISRDLKKIPGKFYYQTPWFVCHYGSLSI